MLQLSTIVMFISLFNLGLCLQPMPRVRGSGTTITAEVGSSVQLICDISNNQRIKAKWARCRQFNKNGACIAFSGISSKRRSKVDSLYDARQDGGSTYIVTIKNIQPNQAGVYLCTLLPARFTTKTVDFINVKVVQKPIINYLKTSADVRTQEGDAINLHCEAFGVPEPFVVWQRVGSTLLPGGGYSRLNGTLEIPSCNQESRGQYTCIASNSFGETRHTIIVDCLGRPKVEASSKINYQKAGYQSALVCSIKSSPEVTNVWWSKDGVELIVEERYKLQTMKAALGRIITKLVIDDGVTVDDYNSNYTCHASNRYGEGNDTLYLKESNSPQPYNGRLKQGKNASATSGVSNVLLLSILICFQFLT